jgi:23S rRNA pseudouridine2605 synthase
VRLNQFLARAGFGSRRACEALILEGAVTINGHRLRELATQVHDHDNVLVHGKPVKMPLTLVAILHKPPGYLCTSPDSTSERTIYDLLPANWPRVVYVGRLDKDSEGLLVVTNDGNLAQRLTHPSHKLRKTYIVTLDKEFDFALAPKMKKGVAIEEGFARMEDVFRVGPRTLKVVLTQGLKRQIREMFFKFGYEVKRLVRIQIGALTLDKMPVGQHRVLTQEEVRRYFPAMPAGRAKGKIPSKPGSRRPPSDGPSSVAKKSPDAQRSTATTEIHPHD